MRMRNRLLAGFGALGAAGAMVLAAPHAHADTTLTYAEQTYADNGAAYAICQDFTRYGVSASSSVYIGQQIASHTSFTLGETGPIIVYSVRNYCPKFWPDLSILVDWAQSQPQGTGV